MERGEGHEAAGASPNQRTKDMAKNQRQRKPNEHILKNKYYVPRTPRITSFLNKYTPGPSANQPYQRLTTKHPDVFVNAVTNSNKIFME